MTDREKVIRAVETCFDSWIDKHRNMGLDLHEVERLKREALELLESQPEIVRCRECRYEAGMDQYGGCMCDIDDEHHPLDWFCADGERWVTLDAAAGTGGGVRNK